MRHIPIVPFGHGITTFQLIQKIKVEGARGRLHRAPSQALHAAGCTWPPREFESCPTLSNNKVAGGIQRHPLVKAPGSHQESRVPSGVRPQLCNICSFLPQRHGAYKAKQPLSQANKQKLFISARKTKPAPP